MPNPVNPQTFNRYSYVHNSPLIYDDPTGHFMRPICNVVSLCPGDEPIDISGRSWLGKQWARVSCFIGSPCSVDMDAELIMPPSASEYELYAQMELLGLANPMTVIGVDDVISKVGSTGFLEKHIDDFINRAIEKHGNRSFGSTWKAWFDAADQVPSIADNLFYSMGDDGLINGAMKVKNGNFAGQSALYVDNLEGLGNGAGTDLLKTAVSESLERGYKGRIYLTPVEAPEVIEFYTNRGGQLIDGYFYWAESAAQMLLNQ